MDSRGAILLLKPQETAQTYAAKQLTNLIRVGGKRAEEALHRWIEPVGWIAVGLVVVVFIYFKFIR